MTPPMFFGFRERELILSVFEAITGLRMNNAYIRPGGLATDLPDDGPSGYGTYSRFCRAGYASSKTC